MLHLHPDGREIAHLCIPELLEAGAAGRLRFWPSSDFDKPPTSNHLKQGLVNALFFKFSIQRCQAT
jgi:hypothetical protein